MTKFLLAAFVVASLAPMAHAGPLPQHDLVVTRQHDYWLSDRLNRLVFWKAPAADRDQSRRQ